MGETATIAIVSEAASESPHEAQHDVGASHQESRRVVQLAMLHVVQYHLLRRQNRHRRRPTPIRPWARSKHSPAYSTLSFSRLLPNSLLVEARPILPLVRRSS